MINEYYYQDVSERWVDKIPSHWEMLRLKRILQIRKEKNNPVVTDFILSLTASQGVVPIAEKEGAGGNKPKDDLTKYSIARKNDLLVNCMNVVAGSAGVSKWDGAISPVYYALYPRDEDNCNIWYFHYLFRLLPFQRSLLGLGKGILLHESSTGKLNTVRMRISMDYLNNVNLPLPPRDEQDKIVAYLNWKTSMINRMISAKKREIKLLKEYNSDMISLEKQISDVAEGLKDVVTKSELADMMNSFVSDDDEKWLMFNAKFSSADEVYESIYKQAKSSIYVVDNYIGLRTLVHLKNSPTGVDIILFSDNVGNNKLHNIEFTDFCKEYPTVNLSMKKTGGIFHDRFIVLDYGTADERVFLCGASSKDAGARITSIVEDYGISKVMMPTKWIEQNIKCSLFLLFHIARTQSSLR